MCLSVICIQRLSVVSPSPPSLSLSLWSALAVFGLPSLSLFRLSSLVCPLFLVCPLYCLPSLSGLLSLSLSLVRGPSGLLSLVYPPLSLSTTLLSLIYPPLSRLPSSLSRLPSSLSRILSSLLHLPSSLVYPPLSFVSPPRSLVSHPLSFVSPALSCWFAYLWSALSLVCPPVYYMFAFIFAGKHKGTPMLRNGIKCVAVDPDDDSEQSDWAGFN